MKNNHNDLVELLRELKCRVSADEIPAEQAAAVCAFLKREKSARSIYRLGQLLNRCGLQKNQLRTFDQYDWDFNPQTPRKEIMAFRASRWVETAANLTLIGDVGLGKSHLAKALCYDAIQQGYPAYFTTAFDLIFKIKRSPSGAYKIDFYGKALKVLCIDELGYTVYQKEDTDILFQIISKRSEMLPTIVTTNLVPSKWGTIFSGPAASAILDRLSFNGKFLPWDGKSYRDPKNRKK